MPPPPPASPQTRPQLQWQASAQKAWSLITHRPGSSSALSITTLAPILALFLADALLTVLIVLRVPYTEIDYKAYMQQLDQILPLGGISGVVGGGSGSAKGGGERDYALVRGDTGPLVYPAGHVWFYSLLREVVFVDGSEDGEVGRAQWCFALLYLLGLVVVMGGCYRLVRAPPYLLPLLILSKRLHSIFVLRLFNDGVAALAFFAAIYCFQTRRFLLGSAAFSAAVSVKMSILLAAPGVGMLLIQAVSPSWAVTCAAVMVQIQVLLGLPFLLVHPVSYLTRAFQFSRQFLFKWTVNWRFVGEETFISPVFARSLLGVNLLGLVVFAYTRWNKPSGLSPVHLLRTTILKPPPPDFQRQTQARVTPEYVMTTILSSMMLGLLCARTLHYQFFAYISWSSPYLLWKAGLPGWAIYLVWAAQEWAWNVYPSTNASSVIVVLCLAVQVLGVWVNNPDDGSEAITEPIEGKKKR